MNILIIPLLIIPNFHFTKVCFRPFRTHIGMVSTRIISIIILVCDIVISMGTAEVITYLETVIMISETSSIC